MERLARKLLALLFVGLAAVAAPACGGDDEEEEEDGIGVVSPAVR